MNPHSPRLSSSRARLVIVLLLPVALAVAATVARKGQKRLAPPQPLGVPVQSNLQKLDVPLAELIRERPPLDVLKTLTRHSPEDDLLALFPRPQAQEEFEGDVEERRNWFLF